LFIISNKIVLKMLSKLVSRYTSQQALLNTSQRLFRTSAVVNKKPSIGDAVTILQSKVSSINQVVSNTSTFGPPYIILIIDALNDAVNMGDHYFILDANFFILNRTT